MKQQHAYIIYFFILCLIPCISTAQPRFNQRNTYWSVGLQLNSMNYFGDLNPQTSFMSTDFSQTRPGFGLQAEYKFHANFRFRVSAMAGRLQGDDSKAANPNTPQGIYRYTRNLHFRNDLAELSTVLVFDLFSNDNRFYASKTFVPYLFAGVGVLYHNPKAKTPENSPISPNEWVSLQALGTEGQGNPGFADKYSLIQISVPIGIGIRCQINPRFNLSFETGLRMTFTDYLDDVGGNYPGYEALSDPLARIMSDRSSEVNAVLSGEVRNHELIESRLGSPVTTTTSDGNTYTHYKGFGEVNEIRGKGSNDYFISTGVHLNYIISVRRYRPMRR